jgi:hypothetical protein
MCKCKLLWLSCVTRFCHTCLLLTDTQNVSKLMLVGQLDFNNILMIQMFQLRNLSDEKQTMIASNKSVAEYNLSRQPRLAQAKSQLASTYEKAVEVQKSFEANKQKLGEWISKWRAGMMLNQYSMLACGTTIFEKQGSPAQNLVVLPHKEL